MAPRRVIEDSDEDDGSCGSPELLSPYMAINEVGAVPMMQPSSTDPVLFRAVYEEHLGQLLVDDQLPNHGQSPIFEDPIIDQRMSSSASVPSALRLKRSKTMNASSLSSITEPTLSNWKVRGTESMRVVDDLTQITTPRKSKDAVQKDPWEVPTSSASDRPLDSNAKVTSRNMERKNPLKTYGRQIRRTQTVAHTRQSTSTDPSLSSRKKDDMLQTRDRDRSEQNKEVDDLPIPKSKRQKLGPSMTVKSHEPVRKEPLDTIGKEAFHLSRDTASTSIGSIPIEVQRSTSVQADVGTNESTAVNAHDFSSLSFKTQTNPDSTVEDSYHLTKSSAAQVSGKSLRSLVVIPNTLSDEQKLQYETISVASTARSRQSSPSATRDMIHSQAQRAGDSLPELSPGTLEDKAPVTLLSSSPPVSAVNRKMKRAKSEVGSKRMPISATIGHQNKVVKRKGRSKTIAQGDKPPCRESSVDELSLTSVDSAQKSVLREASTRTGKKRAYSEDEHELSTTDELHNMDDTGLVEEQYQPRPSQRRLKSISAMASKDDADLHLPRVKVVRKKSLKALDTQSDSAPGDVELSRDTLVHASVIQDASAIAASLSKKCTTKDNVQSIDNSIPDGIGNGHALAEKPGDMPVIETVPTVPTQPKKRGRKKTSEIVAAKAKLISKTQSDDSVLVASKDDEAHRNVLREMESNKQPSQEIARTPPTKASVVTITTIPPPAQTPTKDSKRGPDQHSPLQSGKVPYRVGLSKKMRIAPLLKMIKK